MAFTREQAYAALEALKPAPVFLDAYQAKRLPENLEVYFGPPEEFFLASETQELYTQNYLVPILDDGNLGLVTFLDPNSLGLVQMDVESPSQVRSYFCHWQQYLADLMIRIGESEDGDDRLRRIGTIVGFKHTELLFEYFARTRSITGDASHEARRNFTSRFPLEPQV